MMCLEFVLSTNSFSHYLLYCGVEVLGFSQELEFKNLVPISLGFLWIWSIIDAFHYPFLSFTGIIIHKKYPVMSSPQFGSLEVQKSDHLTTLKSDHLSKAVIFSHKFVPHLGMLELM